MSGKIDKPIAALHCNKTGSSKFMYADTNIIGRSVDSFLCLKDPVVSRIHCVINKKDDGFTITDMSNCGTFVNGKKLVKNEPVVLKHRDCIELADSCYTFFTNKKQLSLEDFVESPLKERLSVLESSFSQNISSLEEELKVYKKEETERAEEADKKLAAKRIKYKEECKRLQNLVLTTKIEQEQREKQLKELKDKFKAENENLIAEINLINECRSKKETELKQKMKEIEEHYEKDKQELMLQHEAEIGEIKKKLAVSEEEQEVLLGKKEEVEQKLIETEKVLLESELEQHRISEEKVQLKAKIVDLSQENTKKDEILMKLETEMKNHEEELQKKVAGLEEDLLCSICAEIFIDTTLLNCGHMFCNTCIVQWKHKSKSCPVCRAKITTCIKTVCVDNLIEKSVMILPPDAQERRKLLLEERRNTVKDKPAVPNKRRRRNGRAVRSVNQSVNPLMNILSTQSDFDPFSWPSMTLPSSSNRRHVPHILTPQGTVTVAAIDLTHYPSHPPNPITTATLGPSTSTTTTVVDLTSL